MSFTQFLSPKPHNERQWNERILRMDRGRGINQRNSDRQHRAFNPDRQREIRRQAGRQDLDRELNRIRPQYREYKTSARQIGRAYARIDIYLDTEVDPSNSRHERQIARENRREAINRYNTLAGHFRQNYSNYAIEARQYNENVLSHNREF